MEIGGSLVLGYTAQNRALTLTDNYVAGGQRALRLTSWSNVAMTGNFVHGGLEGLTPSTFPSNTYQTTRPTATRVSVLPNRYEAGRAHIAIYNWPLATLVPVDLSASVGLAPGDPVRDPGRAEFLRHARRLRDLHRQSGLRADVGPDGGWTDRPLLHAHAYGARVRRVRAHEARWHDARSAHSATPPPPTTATAPTASRAADPPARWITILTPQEGTVLTAPAEITITADAGGPHAIRKIAFYSGTRLLGADSTRPFSYRWSRVPAGQHTIVVRSTDAKGEQVDTQMPIVVR